MDQYFAANAVLSKFSRYYMDLKKNLPIRPSEMAVLNILTVTPGPHTPAMLAERLRVSKPMITALVTALSKKGYVTKERSQEDRRAYYVRLTKKAEALVETASADTNKHLDQLIAAMGQTEFDMLVDLTRKANEILEANRGGEYDGSER